MEQFEVERKETRCINLIKDANMEFYLIIPNSNKVSIVLNIMENVNNDIVKNIPDVIDKVVVVPVLNSNVINYLKGVYPSYNQLDSYFSNLINLSYNILTYNKINVENIVYLNNNIVFSNFNNYFINRFKGRVSLIQLISDNSVINNSPIKKEASTVLDSLYNDAIEKKESISKEQVVDKKEPGFVSYVLLGVLVAILSLAFLYLLL